MALADWHRLWCNGCGGFLFHNTVSGGKNCFVNVTGSLYSLEENFTRGCATPYSGGVEFPLPDGAAPSVAGGATHFMNAHSTMIINFVDASPGQEIWVRAFAGFAVASNSNIVLAGNVACVWKKTIYFTLNSLRHSGWN
jgi:hypothetical protein